jgi:hypothetical protein
VYDESKLSTEEKVRQNRVMDSVLLKAKWAGDHITDLDTAMEQFFDTGPYRVRTEKDSETSEYVYYFMGVSPYLRDIVGHVGDALHNLRSSLDHLACQLVLANRAKVERYTRFPIYNRSTKDPQGFFEESVKGMRPDAVNDIAAWKPYEGGNDTLWLLHKLDVLDKHREILGIGTSHLGHSVRPSKNWRHKRIGSNHLPQLSLFLRWITCLSPLPKFAC